MARIVLAALLLTSSSAATSAERQLLNPAVSPDGRRISASVNDGTDRHLYIIDVDTGAATRASELTGVQYSDWHPRGRLLAFDCSCSPGVSVMFILDTDTGTLRNIRSPRGYLFSAGPRWSPDGERIAFAAFPRSYGADETWLGDIFIYDIETREHQLVSDHDAAEEFPDWLDDDTLVIDGTQSGSYRLSRLDIATGRYEPLAHDDAYQDAWGSVSPDQKRVAFNRTPKDSLAWQIAVVELASGEVTLYPTPFAKAMFPRWSSDSGRIVFYGGTPGMFRLYELDIGDASPSPRAIGVRFSN